MSDLTSALCSRIFHDLASPLGAIASGIELIELNGTLTPEHALIAESGGAALARLRFFRWAFGQMTTGTMHAQEVQDVFASVTPRIKVADLPDTLIERDVKLLSLCLGACVDTKLGSATIYVDHVSGGLLASLPAEVNLSAHDQRLVFLVALNMMAANGIILAKSRLNALTIQYAPESF
ncbi:MAG: hypothetical protein AAFR98_11275 [Pseudomonadota bacterium]